AYGPAAIAPTVSVAAPQLPGGAIGAPPAAARRVGPDESRVGMWIGFGGVVLLSGVCLLGSFLCIVSGLLR
nr:hypothetical protein [Myxococcota bacterium]